MRLLVAMLVGCGLSLGIDPALARICVQDEHGRVLCGQRIHPDFAPQPAPAPQAAPWHGEAEEDDGEFEAVVPQYRLREYGAAPGYGGYGVPPPPPYDRPHWRDHDRGYFAMREWYPIGPGGTCPRGYTIQHGRCEPYRGK